MQKIRFKRKTKYIRSLGIYDSNSAHIPFYENEYTKINTSLHEEDADTKFQAIKKILNLLPLKDIDTISDVGCGSCLVLTKILDHLCHTRNNISAIGIDVSFQILTKSYNHYNLIKLRSNCDDIPLEDKAISLSMCIDIVEHVNNAPTFLKEISRISEFVIFKIPLELSLYTALKGGHRRLSRMEAKYGHINHFDRNKILQLIQEHFEIMYEDYEKIPDRTLLIDKLQTLLIHSQMKRLFSFTFGGFVMFLAKSKYSKANRTIHYDCNDIKECLL